MGHCDPSNEQKEIHVLVSGAGPFLKYKTNPSNLIASALPTVLRPSSPGAPEIHVHATPDPWRVSYTWVREHIPPLIFSSEHSSSSTTAIEARDDKDVNAKANIYELLNPNGAASSSISDARAGVVQSESKRSARPNYDVVMFIGMAGGRKYYTMENMAHRDGYKIPDVDGNNLAEDTLWKDAGAPETLNTGFDGEDVWRRWKGSIVEEDVRPSHNAGHYLCDFIFYTGLLEYWKQDSAADKPVVFLHVPGEHTEKDIEKGIKVASALLRALVESHIARGKFL